MMVKGNSHSEEDIAHLKTLSSGSLQQHLNFLSSRLEEDDAAASQGALSARSNYSSTSSLAPATTANVQISEAELALMLQSANILMKARVNQHNMYYGAIMAEWCYLNAANPKSQEAAGTGINSTNTHLQKGYAAGQGSDSAVLERVFDLIQKTSGLGIMELNAELGRSHIEIFRRQGLLSEPYHVRRAMILLKDAYKRKEAYDKKHEPKNSGGGWLSGLLGSNSGPDRTAVSSLMYWEIYGTRAPEAAPSANNTIATPGDKKSLGSGSKFIDKSQLRTSKKLRYSTRQKYRKLLTYSIPDMYCTALQHAGELSDASSVALDMLNIARTEIEYVETAIADARKELLVEIAKVKDQAAFIQDGGSVGGISLGSYSGAGSVQTGLSRQSQYEHDQAVARKTKSDPHKKKGVKEDDLIKDPLAPARKEVLFRKEKVVSLKSLLYASLLMGLTSYQDATEIITPLLPQRCIPLEEELPPPPRSKPSTASGSRPGSHLGCKPGTPAPDMAQVDDTAPREDHPLPDGLSAFDMMFIAGRCSELLVEQKLGIKSPMDGYLPAYTTANKIRKAEDLKRFEMEMAERKKWEKARSNAVRRGGLSCGGDDQDSTQFSPHKSQTSVDDANDSKNGNGDIEEKKEVEVKLDMTDVIAERLKIKQEAFRRRTELRKMRKKGIVKAQADDPNSKLREQTMKRLRSECKQWLAQYEIWAQVADKCMHIGLPSLAADLYRQGILRDNVGYSRPKLWFSWAKACHQCGRDYDTKLAINQVQHFENDNQQVKRIRKHMNIIGHGKSNRHGTNVETRTTFESAIRSRTEILGILQKIVTPSSLHLYQMFAAAKLTGFVRKVAQKKKAIKDAAESERLQNIWKNKPAVTPEIIWPQPARVFYPSFLSRGVELNAYAPMPPDSDDDSESEGDSDDDDDDDSDDPGNLGDEDNFDNESLAANLDENGEEEKLTKKQRKKRRAKKKAADAAAAAAEGDVAHDVELDDMGSLGTLDTSESLALAGTRLKRENFISGKWVYNPDDRAAPLSAGVHELTVHFYPDDIEKYTSAVALTTIVVAMNANPVDVEWNPPVSKYIGHLLTQEADLNALILIGDESLTEEVIYANNMGTVEYRPVLGAHLPVGRHKLRIVYTPHDTQNYGGATASVEFIVKPFLSDVKWVTPQETEYPQRLREGVELSAFCTEQEGTYVYTPSSHSDPLPVGKHLLRCEFWPYDDLHYGVVTVYTDFTVTKRKPSIEWTEPYRIYVGDSVTYTEHMNAKVLFEKRSDVPDLTGTFRYNMDEYLLLPCGHHTLKCLFFPNDTSNYTFNTAESSITVRCKPTIVWTNVPIIRFGNAVEEKHLNATVAECTGLFVYEPVVGVVPVSGGKQEFKVVFTPDDLTLYDVMDLTITVDVEPKLKPNLSWDSKPVSYGTPIGLDNVLNATTDQEGYWEYEGSGVFVTKDQSGQLVVNSDADKEAILKPCGSYIVQATFYPVDAFNYEHVSLVGTVVVEKMAIALTYGPFPEVTYGTITTEDHFKASLLGETICASAIAAGGANATTKDSSFGTFTYSHTAGLILKAGTHDFEVKFIPSDLENYTEAGIVSHLKVLRHEPDVKWKKPSSIQYSDLISEKQLNAWVSDNVRDLPKDKQKIDGTITYSLEMGHRFPKVGRHPISLTFVPDDGFNYSTINIDFEISMRRFPVKVFWGNPAEIFEGQKLTEEQLNATHNFPDLSPDEGVLVYEPLMGKKLEQGEHSLLCKYVPHAKVRDNFDLRQGFSEVTIFIAPTRSGMKSRGR